MAEYSERDAERTIILGSEDGVVWEPIWDPSGGGVGGGGGTEYTEGATDATITGGVVMWEDAADTVRAVSAAFPLPVEIISGGGGGGSGTEYIEGATDATITGTAIMWEDTADTLRAVSAANPLPVEVSGVATEATLAAVETAVDGVEALLTTIDADTSTLAAVDYVTGADVAALGVVGGGTEATALRVTVANNSTGVLSVDDNGSTLSIDDGAGSITVDAPVATPVFVRLSDGSAAITTLPVSVSGVSTAANQATVIAAIDGLEGSVDGIEGLLTTIDADTGGILTAVQTLDNAISGNEMQVDVVAALPAGTNNIGDVDIASSVDIMLGNAGTGNATHSSVACSTTSATLLAANAARNGATIYNGTGQTLYVRFQSTAATTSAYTVQMPNSTVYDLPGPNVYAGAITGILSTGSGNAQVTEW